MARQKPLVSKKKKEQLKNARKKRKIENSIGEKITTGEEGVTGEAGIRGSGDGLGESACPEPEDEAVKCTASASYLLMEQMNALTNLSA